MLAAIYKPELAQALHLLAPERRLGQDMELHRPLDAGSRPERIAFGVVEGGAAGIGAPSSCPLAAGAVEHRANDALENPLEGSTGPGIPSASIRRRRAPPEGAALVV
jgi:hypothetical protein